MIFDHSMKYDVIIIGSGIGGLAAGAMLAKYANKRVLILEQHTKIGGLTHTFRRKQFEWDVGLHYVGDLESGSLFRKLFDHVTGGRLHWQKMPSPFERFFFPGLTIEQPDSLSEYQKILCSHFPGAATDIARCFDDAKRASAWFIVHHLKRVASPLLYLPMSLSARGGEQLAKMHTADYLASRIQDRRLRAVLSATWGNYGLPPEESSFGIHALITAHYQHGAWYPVGGAGRIAAEIKKTIEANGGAIQCGKTVKQILVDNDNRAIGVRTADKFLSGAKSDILAPLIISDVGIRATYNLIPGNKAIAAVKNAIDQFPTGRSAVTLYLGLAESPAKFGLCGENVWLNESYEIDTVTATAHLLTGAPTSAYISFPSLKNPVTRTHTAEIIAMVDTNGFDLWRESSWRRRPADYEALKKTITDGLIKFVNRHIHGFAAIISYAELSTPLSIEHFTGRARGEMYGLAETPERLKIDWLGPDTPIKNLYLAGSDAFSLGIEGAFMGGLMTAARATGMLGLERLIWSVLRN